MACVLVEARCQSDAIRKAQAEQVDCLGRKDRFAAHQPQTDTGVQGRQRNGMRPLRIELEQ